MARRRGRGRLSSIELLPPDAEPIVAWAMGELRARRHTQVDILDEFNKRLRGLAAELGTDIAPISLSAFNRYAVRLATLARRLEETREISAALTDRLQPGDADNLTVMVAETIKTLIFEILESDGDSAAGVAGAAEGAEAPARIDTKGAMELARALQAAVSAQSISSERRRRVEKDFADRAAKAIDRAAKAKGLTAETVETIKAEILGVRA